MTKLSVSHHIYLVWTHTDGSAQTRSSEQDGSVSVTSSLLLRVQEVKELGDLSPHWDGLRHDVINHCNLLIGCYQETLAELDRLSGKVH